MPMNDRERNRVCDVLIVGSGAGGLSTAITAKKGGLDVVIIEKEAFFGGTTAYSGGVLWIPGNPHARKAGINDTREAAVTYLRNETGNCFSEKAIEAFLDQGPRMLEFFERETEAKFLLSGYPDYHPDVEGGALIGRSVTAAPFDARGLGDELKRLRPPLATITFIGMMFNSSNEDLKHFFRATRSLKSATYVAKRLISHLKDLALYRRGVQITSGNALAARLAKTCFDLGIPLLTSTAARQLIVEDGSVRGAQVSDDKGEFTITARRAVVMACGGFPHDRERISRVYPHLARGGEHFSPTPEGNTGDGVRMAENVGASCEIRFPNAAAWMPVSRIPMGNGKVGLFPHLVDRYKPGIIAVNRRGKRFTNESNSYHDTGAAMIADGEGDAETGAWLICDHPTIRKYGLGYAKPAPVPISKAPYYALKVVMGDLGTFDGLTTDIVGRVLDGTFKPIPGLYAVGNDRASIMGGNYPGAGMTLGPIMTFGYVTGQHLAGRDVLNAE